METDGMVERTRDLFALITEHVTDEAVAFTVTVLCNGCGNLGIAVAPTRERVEALLTVVFGEWTITPEPEDRDLCPACTRRAA